MFRVFITLWGGIRVDRQHRTDHKGLYAAGECACQYHGANRLGGNSLLGALYGGKIAARSAIEDDFDMSGTAEPRPKKSPFKTAEGSYVDRILEMRSILQNELGIVRDGETLQLALSKLIDEYEQVCGSYDPSASVYENEMLQNCFLLGQALLMSADSRKESRGAHTRSSNRKLKNDCLTENTPGIDFSNLSERLKERFFQKCDFR